MIRGVRRSVSGGSTRIVGDVIVWAAKTIATERTAVLGGCPSGQRELTVNQPAYAYGGSNPPPPTRAHIAQSVERILGKNEVTGSSPVVGSSMWLILGSADMAVHRLVGGR